MVSKHLNRVSVADSHGKVATMSLEEMAGTDAEPFDAVLSGDLPEPDVASARAPSPRRGVRARPDSNGRFVTNVSFSPEIRYALEDAKRELGKSFVVIIEDALRQYLIGEGLRVVDPSEDG